MMREALEESCSPQRRRNAHCLREDSIMQELQVLLQRVDGAIAV